METKRNELKLLIWIAASRPWFLMVFPGCSSIRMIRSPFLLSVLLAVPVPSRATPGKVASKGETGSRSGFFASLTAKKRTGEDFRAQPGPCSSRWRGTRRRFRGLHAFKTDSKQGWRGTTTASGKHKASLLADSIPAAGRRRFHQRQDGASASDQRGLSRRDSQQSWLPRQSAVRRMRLGGLQHHPKGAE